MRWIEDLEAGIGAEGSPFRAQLLREDVARLRRLVTIAAAAADVETFRAAGRRLGWTQGDQRTGEVAEELDALLDAVYEHTRRGDAESEQRARFAWQALTRARVEKLVGCLSMPTPRPPGPRA